MFRQLTYSLTLLMAIACSGNAPATGGDTTSAGVNYQQMPGSQPDIESEETPANESIMDGSVTPTAGAQAIDEPALAGAPSPPNAPPTSLTGAFLLVLNNQTEAFWKEAVRDAASFGIKTLYLQTESYLTQAGSRNAVETRFIQAVLDEAALADVEVYIGLVLPEWGNGSVTFAKDRNFASTLINASKVSADGVFDRFKSSSAWKGWYLPAELWTPGSAGELGQLPRYVSEISAYARSVAELPIAISPFISDLATDPQLVETEWKKIIADSSLDRVLLQDGVGARAVATTELNTRVTRFFQALRAACSAPACELHANLEAFDASNQPTSSERFTAQIEAVQSSVDALLTYEWSYHWMTKGPGSSLATPLRQGYLDFVDAD